MKKKKEAFTLVELIIVVVIIAILATIAFLTLWDYPMQARDARRLSDKNNIEKALEIYRAEKWEYPKFDEENWQKIFWTWAWEKVNTSLSTLPRDPLTNKLYKIEIKETPDKVKIAKVVLEWESWFTNWSLANNTTTSWKSEENKEVDLDSLSKEERKKQIEKFKELWYSPNWKIFLWEPQKETCERDSHWRFKVEGNIITDTRTDLVWSKEIPSWKNWEQAKEYCENLTTWGKEWRLPDITELNSIVNYSCYDPATYSEFDFIKSNDYYSSNIAEIAYIWGYYFDKFGKFIYGQSFYSWTFSSTYGDFTHFICVWKTKSKKLVWQWTPEKYYDSTYHVWKSYKSEQSFEFIDGTTKWLNWIVRDKNTWLIWQSKSYYYGDHREAENYCKNLGKWWKKWRLPSIVELKTLSDYSRYKDGNFNMLNSDYFDIYTDRPYWSSTWYWTNDWESNFYIDFNFANVRSDTYMRKYYSLCVSDPE